MVNGLYIAGTTPASKIAVSEQQLRSVQLERYHFESILDGPRLTVTARIHGDEPSGEFAIRKLIKELTDDNNPLRLKRGSLTLFPVVNQPAAFLNQRGVTRDGNRHVHKISKLPSGAPIDPEARINDALAREFRKQRVHNFTSLAGGWHYIDLHDYPTPGGQAHVVVGQARGDLEAAKSIGLNTIVTNWREAQTDQLGDVELKAIGRGRKDQERHTTTAIYAAAQHGAASAICIESGSCADNVGRSKAHAVAYEALRNRASDLGLLDPLGRRKHTRAKIFTNVAIQATFYKLDGHDELADGIVHGAHIDQAQGVVHNQGRLFLPPTPPSGDGHWEAVHPITGDVHVGDHLVHLGWVSKLNGPK